MAGIYRFLVIASGVDYEGMPFTREQILTVSVFQGGNNPGTLVERTQGTAQALQRYISVVNSWLG
jgi:hypothetical protein